MGWGGGVLVCAPSTKTHQTTKHKTHPNPTNKQNTKNKNNKVVGTKYVRLYAPAQG